MNKRYICIMIIITILFSTNVFTNEIIDRTKEFSLGAGDEIAIYIWKNDELNTITSIQPDGRITLPLIGEILASGKTSYELELIITKKYKEYIRDPQVRVIVKKYISKEVTIFGNLNDNESRGVGKYPINENTTLADVLALAGWFTDQADIKNIEIRRKDIAKPIIIDFSKYLSGLDVKSNILLKPNDKIYVPRKEKLDKIYVLGEVGSPGMLDYKKGMTILEALTLAGNITDNAVSDNTKIYRGDITQPTKTNLITVDAEAIIKKGELNRNIELVSNDIIYVPREKIVSWNMFMAKIMPSIQFAMTTYGIISGGLGVSVPLQ